MTKTTIKNTSHLTLHTSHLKKILFWANSFTHCTYLNPNDFGDIYPQKPFKKLLAIGAKKIVNFTKIAENNQGNNFYSRDGTWYSNMGMFIKNKSVYVFSAATEDKNYFTIDEYSYNNLNYIQSYKLDYKGMNSNNIMSLQEAKNELIICFDYNYASFKIL